MLNLKGTTEVIQLITGAAGDIRVTRSAVDVSDAAPPVVQIIPDLGPRAAITTATTTDIVAAPGASLCRNVENLTIYNASTTISNPITLQNYDGTNTAPIVSLTLLPGETLIFDEIGMPHHLDSTGAEYNYGGPPVANLGITGTIAESMPRETCPEVNTTVAASGTLFMQAIYLNAGQIISNIIMSSATTAAGTPTNNILGLYDANRNLLAQTANQTTAAWAANTIKTLALTASYRVPTSGLYYIGYFMTATTVITAKGGTAKTGGQLAAAAPILHGTSSTGLTTSLPNPAAAITAGTASIYVAVS